MSAHHNSIPHYAATPCGQFYALCAHVGLVNGATTPIIDLTQDTHGLCNLSFSHTQLRSFERGEFWPRFQIGGIEMATQLLTCLTVDHRSRSRAITMFDCCDNETSRSHLGTVLGITGARTGNTMRKDDEWKPRQAVVVRGMFGFIVQVGLGSAAATAMEWGVHMGWYGSAAREHPQGKGEDAPGQFVVELREARVAFGSA